MRLPWTSAPSAPDRGGSQHGYGNRAVLISVEVSSGWPPVWISSCHASLHLLAYHVLN